MVIWIAFLMLAASASFDNADIVNSGSTNTRGYVLHLNRSGPIVVDWQDGTKPNAVHVAPALVERFFAALDASMPLAALPSGNCPKSKSFGYSLQVRYGDANSPDLTCPVGSNANALASVASEIARAAQVSERARRPAPAP